MLPPERHSSLISLPDFGLPHESQHEQLFNSTFTTNNAEGTSSTGGGGANFDSYLLTQRDKEAARLISARQASIADFTTKFPTGKVDLAAAFRRQMSLPSASRSIKLSGAESVYSATTARSELQYDPVDSKTKGRSSYRSSQALQPLGYRPSPSIRDTATFGVTNDNVSDLNSEKHFVESSYRRPPHPTSHRKALHHKSSSMNLYESSEAGDTDYTSYYPRQRRRRSNSVPEAKKPSRREHDNNGSRGQNYGNRQRRYNHSRPPYNQRNGPLMQAMSSNGTMLTPFHHAQLPPHGRMLSPYHPMPYHQPLGYPMMPPPIQQPGEANQHLALSPIASRSLLTCSREFQAQFPNVYSGLCKGLIDVNRLVQHEVVIPIKEEIALHKNAIRSRRAVIAAISEQLWKPLHGKFPDPAIAPKLVKKVSEYFFDKIEGGIQQAEDERSFLQWVFRFDVENAIEIRVTTSLGVGYNSAIANIEGTAHIKRHKGDIFSLLNPDTVTVDMDIIVKALFLNGGQLTEINNDPMFIDRVQAGENRFAASFINLY